MSMAAVVLGHLPFAAAGLLYSGLPDHGSIPFMAAGAVLHTGYQLFLLYSYSIGDLSQVYPLARGAAPMLVAGISVLLLGADLSQFELAAIIIIGAGIMSLAMARRDDGFRNGRAAAFAIATGGFIAAYSLVDGFGARQAGSALGFYSCLSILNALIFGSIMGVVRPGLIKNLIYKNHGLTFFGGGASFTAYALVIWAFTQAPIAKVTALRETSIIFALLLGVFGLRERFEPIKIFATTLTLIGVIMLRLH